MTHTVLVTAHPQLSSVNRMALSYCQSIVAKGEMISQIFFMHDANYTAIHPSAQQWSSFAAGHGIALQTCVSTAEEKSIHLRDYAAGFQQGGLSTLADSLLSSEYFIQFNVGFDETEMNQQRALSGAKKIVFVFDSMPEEGSLAAEGVDLLLVLSAFEADVAIIFKDDGVQNIVPSKRDIRPRYTKRFKALPDFGLDRVFVSGSNQQKDSLQNTVQLFDVECEMIDEAAYLQLVHDAHTLYF